MTPVLEATAPETTFARPPAAPVTDMDLVAAVRAVLQGSSEPLTPSKIRAGLPTSLRQVSLEDLAESLRKQVAANALIQFPKYRSPHDRFWDRPMPVHVAALVRMTLEEGSLALSELRRKLPLYAQSLCETILQEQVQQGLLHRHPRLTTRGGDRFGVRPADPKDYLRPELMRLFTEMQQLGFTQTQLRESALELLHEEEWAPTPPADTKAEASAEMATDAPPVAATPLS